MLLRVAAADADHTLRCGNGNTVAQQDSIPLGGARPTTGWAPGEILTDPYAIFIPADVSPDRYRVRIGWYNAVTGKRVSLPGGSEFWTVPESVRIIAP